MPSTNATDAVISSDLPMRQHEAYFPIGSDPHLLVEYRLDFFGPERPEPMFTSYTVLETRFLLLKRSESCNKHIRAIRLAKSRA
jgi:hypothetical protein